MKRIASKDACAVMSIAGSLVPVTSYEELWDWLLAAGEDTLFNVLEMDDSGDIVDFGTIGGFTGNSGDISPWCIVYCPKLTRKLEIWIEVPVGMGNMEGILDAGEYNGIEVAYGLEFKRAVALKVTQADLCKIIPIGAVLEVVANGREEVTE